MIGATLGGPRSTLTNWSGSHEPAKVYAEKVQARSVSQGAFCARCNAWRGALGLEPDPALYVAHLVEVFRAVRRVLRDDGTCWVNLGDAYAGSWGAQSRPNGTDIASTLEGGSMLSARQIAAHPKGQSQTGSLKNTPGLKAKDLIGLPWRVAFALQADGWWLRSEIIWAKSNPMPESVTDRPTKAHEQLFLLAKAERYFFDAEAIREPHSPATLDRWNGIPTRRNPSPQGLMVQGVNGESTMGADPAGRSKRSVWTIPSAPFSEAHFATFPPALVEPCVQAGTSARGACPACGAPWRREVETTGRILASDGRDEYGAYVTRRACGEVAGPQPQSGPGGTAAMPRIERLTTSWAPACACAVGEPRPCVVLDPFGGAGTTALVAERLGRDAILIELKPEYASLAEKRIREEAPLLTAVEVEAAAPAASGNGHGPAAPEQLALEWSG
jgi:DNA modification methylase